MSFQQGFGMPFCPPAAACLLLAAAWGRPLAWGLLLVVSVALIGAVLVAVHHAEVVAHRVGEPFGTLIPTNHFTELAQKAAQTPELKH